MSATFEPEVVAFCCRHCAYAAADLAGSARQAYPTAVKVIELPCTGRIDIINLLHAFENGADGVLIAGCLEGKCHYLKGNLHARQRVRHVQKLMDDIGLSEEQAYKHLRKMAMDRGQRLGQVAERVVAAKKLLG